MNKQKILRNSGITLITLMITIIILLILSGVIIAELSGESGLISRTKHARENIENAQNFENKILDDYQNKIEYIGNENNINNSEELMDREPIEFKASNSNIINTNQSFFQSVNGVTIHKGETKKINITDNLIGLNLVVQMQIRYGRNENSVGIYFYNNNNEQISDIGTHFEFAGGHTQTITENYNIPQNCKYIEFWVGDGAYSPYMKINNIGMEYNVLNISGETIGRNQPLTLKGLKLPYYNLKIENKTKGTTKILYKIDDGEWKTYNNEVLKIDKICTIYVRGYNENNEIGIIEKAFEIKNKGLTNNSFDSNDSTYDIITNSNNTKIAISPELYGKTLQIKLEARYGRNTNSVAIYFYDENDEKITDLGTYFEYTGGITNKTTKEYNISENCKYIEFWVGDGPYNPYMYIYEILIK